MGYGWVQWMISVSDERKGIEHTQEQLWGASSVYWTLGGVFMPPRRWPSRFVWPCTIGQGGGDDASSTYSGAGESRGGNLIRPNKE